MKNLFLLLLITLCSNVAKAQYYETRYRQEPLIEPASFFVPDRLKIGGKDRNSVSFTIPKNTVQYFYRISVFKNEKEVKPSTLNSEIGGIIQKGIVAVGGSAAAASGVGLAALVAKELTKPDGSAHLDFYLHNEQGHNAFMATEDLLGTWLYTDNIPGKLSEGTHEHLMAGNFVVKENLSGRYYLDFKNAQLRGSAFTQIEVVAIVAERVYVDEWIDASINGIHKDCASSFAFDDKNVQDVCSCVANNLKASIKPSEYINASSERKSQFINENKKQCFITTGNESLGQKDEEVATLLNQANAYSLSRDYKKATETYSRLIELGVANSYTYGAAGRNALFAQDYESAKGFFAKGIAVAPDDLFLCSNLAHCFLLTNQYYEAEVAYLQHKRKRYDKKPWKKYIADELEMFEKMGMAHVDFDKVRRALKIKIKGEGFNPMKVFKKQE